MDDGKAGSDSPLQAAMRAALRFGTGRTAPPLSLREDLKAMILEHVADAIGPITARPRTSPLVIDRVNLADVHACEAFFVEGSDAPFLYDVKKARGQIAFTTIRRWYFRSPENSSAEFDVIAAVEDVIDGAGSEGGALGEYVAKLSSGERAELVAEAVNITYAFLETWPEQLTPRPVRSHCRLRTVMLDGRLELTYRVSFRFGQAYRDPAGGLIAAAILLDVRAGRQYEEEERANRFFASLIDTIATGVPPARVATWYAESQEVRVDEVGLDSLEAAARRVGEGVRKIVRLHHHGQSPERRPGWRCTYCVLLDECSTGQVHRTRNRM